MSYTFGSFAMNPNFCGFNNNYMAYQLPNTNFYGYNTFSSSSSSSNSSSSKSSAKASTPTQEKPKVLTQKDITAVWEKH